MFQRPTAYVASKHYSYLFVEPFYTQSPFPACIVPLTYMLSNGTQGGTIDFQHHGIGWHNHCIGFQRHDIGCHHHCIGCHHHGKGCYNHGTNPIASQHPIPLYSIPFFFFFFYLSPSCLGGRCGGCKTFWTCPLPRPRRTPPTQWPTFNREAPYHRFRGVSDGHAAHLQLIRKTWLSCAKFHLALEATIFVPLKALNILYVRAVLRGRGVSFPFRTAF